MLYLENILHVYVTDRNQMDGKFVSKRNGKIFLHVFHSSALLLWEILIQQVSPSII